MRRIPSKDNITLLLDADRKRKYEAKGSKFNLRNQLNISQESIVTIEKGQRNISVECDVSLSVARRASLQINR